jgi:signal peptidase II
MNKVLPKIRPQNIAIIFLIALFFIADRFLKAFALKLSSQQNYQILDDCLVFGFTPNYNIAFSLPLSGAWLLPIISVIIIGLIFITSQTIYQEKKISKNSIFLLLIIFGAISNAVDRALYGFVVDYLEIKSLTILNLADIMISVGAILLLKESFCTNTKNSKSC